MPTDSEPPPPRWSLAALCACVLAVYAVVLGAGFIDYDDAWLITENPLLREASPRALARVWTDFGLGTRMILGAEYLPVRDTVAWLIARAVGPAPWAFHAVQLAAYLGAVTLLRGWLHRVWPAPVTVERCVWLFALHPAHVSSVAWAAGLKDALSLLFLAAALRVYASSSARARPVAVALAVALACLSKGTSVIAPALLLAGDLLAQRRPRWVSVVAASVVVGASLWAQTRVGAVVHMIAEPLGRSALDRIASMAPVALRYLAVSALLDPPCVVRVVPARAVTDPAALLSLAALLALAIAAARRWRAGDRVPLVALGVFAVGLAPVSQVLVPLQNRMADRYLLVAVLGPCMLAAHAVSATARAALRHGLSAAMVVACAALSARHAWQFADPSRLWQDAMRRVPESPLSPYQLALRAEARQAEGEAEALYRECLRRDGMRSDLTPRAAANLSRILARTGRGDEAVALLREVVARFEGHPRPLNNLATLLHARGDREQARALFLRLVQRFPDYPRGRANYEARFGPLPAAPARAPGDGWTWDPYAR